MRVPHKKISRIARAVPKPSFDELLASERQFKRAGADFLKVDSATALTFSQTALATDDPSKKQRNRKSARKAYDTILKLMKKIKLSGSDEAEVKGNLERLKSDLTALGETF